MRLYVAALLTEQFPEDVVGPFEGYNDAAAFVNQRPKDEYKRWVVKPLLSRRSYDTTSRDNITRVTDGHQ